MSFENTFIEVTVDDWDFSKVEIGLLKKGDAKPTILYDGKIPVLKVTPAVLTNDDKVKLNSMKMDEKVDFIEKHNYPVFSKSGLKKSMKWNDSQKKYTDIWEGYWNVRFTVTDCVKNSTPTQKKILDIFEDVRAKVAKEYEKEPYPPVQYTWIKQKNEKTGVEKTIGRDDSKGASIKVKVGYGAPEDAKKIKDEKTGADVPIFSARYPKARFLDMSKPAKDRLVKHPDPTLRPKLTEEELAKLSEEERLRYSVDSRDKGAAQGMRACPKFMIGLCVGETAIYITKKLFTCHFIPKHFASDDNEDELAMMLEANMNIATSDVY